MRKAAIISLIGLWVWIAFTLSIHPYWVEKFADGDEYAVSKQEVRRMGEGVYFHDPQKYERRWHLDRVRLVWFLLPPLLALPLLRELWRR